MNRVINEQDLIIEQGGFSIPDLTIILTKFCKIGRIVKLWLLEFELLINEQDLIRANTVEFFEKINRRTCPLIRYIRVIISIELWKCGRYVNIFVQSSQFCWTWLNSHQSFAPRWLCKIRKFALFKHFESRLWQ